MALCSRSVLYQLTHWRVSHSTLGHGFPLAEIGDDLGPEEVNDAFGHGIIMGIADTADRGVDPGIGQPFGVADGQVSLRTAAAV